LPGVLFLCGHEPEGKHSVLYQRVCQLLALRGFVVLCPDTLGQGERAAPAAFKTPTEEHNVVGLKYFAAGRNIASLMTEDALRGLDVLRARAEVDGAKLAVAGNSGGGTLALITALASESVKAAAIGTFVSGFWEIFNSGKRQDAEQIWTGLAGAGFDHADLLMGLIPRPILLLAAEYDYFPFQGTLRTAEITAQAYALAGHPQNFELYHEKTTHTYSDGMAARTAEFFARAFNADITDDTAEPSLVEILPKEALCLTSEGAAKPPAVNLRRELSPEEAGALRALIFKNRGYTAFYPCTAEKGTFRGMAFKRVMWRPCNGVIALATLFNSRGQNSKACLMLWEGGPAACDKHEGVIRETCARGETAAVLDIAGHGLLSPLPVNGMSLTDTLYFLNSWLLMLGDSLAAMRVFSLIRAAEFMKSEFNAKGVEMYTEGLYGLYADYACWAAPELFEGFRGEWNWGLLKTALETENPDQRLWPFVIPGSFAL
jgi:pimeloyl-ACP methyl ester carboxylesterase